MKLESWILWLSTHTATSWTSIPSSNALFLQVREWQEINTFYREQKVLVAYDTMELQRKIEENTVPNFTDKWGRKRKQNKKAGWKD